MVNVKVMSVITKNNGCQQRYELAVAADCQKLYFSENVTVT